MSPHYLRRRAFVASAVGVAAGLAGCAAAQTEFEATPGQFAPDAVDASGYEQVNQEALVIERTVGTDGVERDITVRNYVTTYDRGVRVAGQSRPLAAATVFTTPSLSIAGREFNPVADESLASLAGRASGQVGGQLSGGISDIEPVEERQQTVLDTETTVGVFEGVTEAGPTTVTLRLLVARVKHAGDFVLIGTAYPAALTDEERPRAERLFENVEHETA